MHYRRYVRILNYIRAGAASKKIILKEKMTVPLTYLLVLTISTIKLITTKQ
jgi:hypothetical protein